MRKLWAILSKSEERRGNDILFQVEVKKDEEIMGYFK